jgi:hypothetical protein
LTANVDTFLGAGHYMTTGVTMTREGYVDAYTRTRTITMLGGFTGGVMVVMADVNGMTIGSTSMHSFGVDGTSIGRSDRNERWQETIDPGIASRTASLTVIHAWTPKVSLQQEVQIAIEIGRYIMELIEIMTGKKNAGGGTGPLVPPFVQL